MPEHGRKTFQLVALSLGLDAPLDQLGGDLELTAAFPRESLRLLAVERHLLLGVSLERQDRDDGGSAALRLELEGQSARLARDPAFERAYFGFAAAP